MTKQHITTEHLEANLLSGPSTSYWLKERIKKYQKGEMADAISNVKTLKVNGKKPLNRKVV